MKILCYTSSLGGGGAERQMCYLCNFLSEKGYEVTLTTYSMEEDRYNLSSKVKRIRIGYNIEKSFLHKLIIKIKTFLYFLTVKTDCIISFQIGPNIQVLKPLKFRPKLKVIVSERNLVSWELSPKESYAYMKLYYRANYIVSNSYSMTSYLENLNPKLSHRLKTITNYTDITTYVPSPLPLNDKLQIGVFARFQKQKNYERFALMLKELSKQETRSFVVKWYGDKSDNSCYTQFCHLIEECGIRDYIELYDFVSDVPAEMKKLDIICLPSIYEGFSNSLAEAICSGRPVVTGNVSDNSIMVEDGVNGMLFNPYDIKDMVEVFANILNLSNNQLQIMAINSRKKAEYLFSKEKFVNNYINLIEN